MLWSLRAIDIWLMIGQLADFLDFEALQRLINFLGVEKHRSMPTSQKWNLPCRHECPESPNRNAVVLAKADNVD